MWRRFVATVALTGISTLPTYAQLNWTKASPGGGGSFQTVDVAVDGKVLAGSDLSGAYLRSGTGAWTRLGKRDGIEATAVVAVSWKPGSSLIALAGTKNGLYLTADGGVSWGPIGNVAPKFVSAIGWKGDVAYAAGAASSTDLVSQLAKSTDGGLSWNIITSHNLPTNLRAVKLAGDPFHANTVWLLSGHDGYLGGRKELYKSTTGGLFWGLVSGSFNPIDFALHPTIPDLVLMTASTTGTGGPDDQGAVYSSTNGGTTWNQGTVQNGSPATGAIWWDSTDAYMVNVQADACGASPADRSGKFKGTSTNGWQTSTWTKMDDGVGGLPNTVSWDVAWTDCA